MNSRPDGVPASAVLLVDDAPDTLRWLCDTLESEGYAVFVARSGAEALERLEFVVPDAVLMDAVMPGMSGFEACRRLKAVPAWSHVPVIFMTGLSETDDIVKGFESGGIDYVVKPVRAEEVLARLSAHVRNARVARMARDAVDLGGIGVLMLDSRGRISWRSPQAERWLLDRFPDCGGAPPADWLAQALALDGGGEHAQPVPGQQLVVRSLGHAGFGETMLLLERRAAAAPQDSRLESAALTPREAEVLSWVAKGKTNRDIAEILGMSPRTVNKHLEHVFEKLGVETRAAAAALAARALP